MLVEEEKIPCMICGRPTYMMATKLCDPCWELGKSFRVLLEQNAEAATKWLAERAAECFVGSQEANLEKMEVFFEDKTKLSTKDCKVETEWVVHSGKLAVAVTHLPSGFVEKCEEHFSGSRNQKECLLALRKRLRKAQLDAYEALKEGL